MELTGMALAQTARMRERTVSSGSSNPVTSARTPVSGFQGADTADRGITATEETSPAVGGVDLYAGLDKYDISLIACTD